MDMYLIVYLILVIAPLTTLIHELGHVSGSLIVKADYIQLTMGYGKRQITFNFNQIKFIFYPFYFIGGFTTSDRDKPYKNSEIIWVTILGPVFNAITAWISYYAFEFYPSDFLQLLFWFNIWMAIVNIIPFKINEKQTDGFTILKLMIK
ncbi:site-2 protease family protein [Oceanobacillus sp. CF4.6]|uniref:site-2 protease family protein n=1 Tax=Oceanobacillus sp. CF4.6 TaxID=3373080 RepID=UPI003EE4FCD4